jgi:hypothetical protein
MVPISLEGLGSTCLGHRLNNAGGLLGLHLFVQQPLRVYLDQGAPPTEAHTSDSDHLDPVLQLVLGHRRLQIIEDLRGCRRPTAGGGAAVNADGLLPGPFGVSDLV